MLCTYALCEVLADYEAEAAVKDRQLAMKYKRVSFCSRRCARSRYPWPLQRALYAHALCEVLADFEAEAAVEVGPPALLPGGESGEAARRRLRENLEAFEHEAPFTVQRLAEVLLEPRKQYTRLDKLVRAASACPASWRPTARLWRPPWFDVFRAYCIVCHPFWHFCHG